MTDLRTEFISFLKGLQVGNKAQLEYDISLYRMVPEYVILGFFSAFPNEEDIILGFVNRYACEFSVAEKKKMIKLLSLAKQRCQPLSQ